MKPPPVVIWGAGGHGKVVLDVALSSGIEVVGFLDDRPELAGSAVGNRPVVPSSQLNALRDRHEGLKVLPAIGDNALRRKVFMKLHKRGLVCAAAVHARACVHPSVQLGHGTVIMPGAIINVDTVIGDNVIINTAASVDHDCRIASHCHVAPGVHLAGLVRVEEGAFVGIGSCAIPQRSIGSWAVVGAGSVVVRDVPEGVIVMGVPARVVREGPVA